MRQTHCQTETQCCVSQSNSCSSLPHIKLQQLSLMLFSVMLGRKRSPKPTTVYHSFTQDVPGVFQVFFCSWETMLLPTPVCPLQSESSGTLVGVTAALAHALSLLWQKCFYIQCFLQLGPSSLKIGGYFFVWGKGKRSGQGWE